MITSLEAPVAEFEANISVLNMYASVDIVSTIYSNGNDRSIHPLIPNIIIAHIFIFYIDIPVNCWYDLADIVAAQSLLFFVIKKIR